MASNGTATNVVAMTATEPTCPPAGYEVVRLEDRCVARATRQVRDCTVCSGTGLLRQKVVDGARSYEVAGPCGYQKLLQRIELFNAAQIPAVHAHATLSADSFQPKIQEQARAHSLVRSFCETWPNQRGFILSGPVGTGKTHLLAAALRHATLERGVRAAYVEISLLYATIRRGFAEGKSGGEIIGPLSQVDLLAIDELGKGRGSPFELETLDELIARRYNAGKITLFGTNYSLAAPEEKARGGYLSSDANKEAGRDSKLLCDRVGERIYSRLCEMCDFIELPPATPDHRRAKHAHASPAPLPRRSPSPPRRR